MQEEKAERSRAILEFAIAVIVAVCVTFLTGDPSANVGRAAIVAAIGAGASLAAVLVWRAYVKLRARNNDRPPVSRRDTPVERL